MNYLKFNKCKVQEGQRWDICPDHINSKGVSGKYPCIYMDTDNFIEITMDNGSKRKVWACKFINNILDEELFKI